jgi:hypothetical protein
MGGVSELPQPFSNHDPSELCLPTSWDYRRGPVSLTSLFSHSLAKNRFQTLSCLSGNSSPHSLFRLEDKLLTALVLWQKPRIRYKKYYAVVRQ